MALVDGCLGWSQRWKLISLGLVWLQRQKLEEEKEEDDWQMMWENGRGAPKYRRAVACRVVVWGGYRGNAFCMPASGENER